jgi:hypothetical protein
MEPRRRPAIFIEFRYSAACVPIGPGAVTR